MRTTVLSALYLIVSVGASGCMGQPQVPVAAPTGTPPSMPITEVVQTFAADFETSWDNVLAVLTQRGIDIQMANKEIGRIVTVWVPVEDSMCSLRSASDIPLACRVQFSIAISRMVGEGSSMTIRYLETCADREELSLVCPKSKAETMMVSIVEEMKSIAAVQQRVQ